MNIKSNLEAEPPATASATHSAYYAVCTLQLLVKRKQHSPMGTHPSHLSSGLVALCKEWLSSPKVAGDAAVCKSVNVEL